MPKRFNAATLNVIDFLGGDRRTGMCCCPIHDDSKPSLSISSGNKALVVVHCFGCERDDEIIKYLRVKGVWPTSDKLKGPQASVAVDTARSPEDRRQYAVSIWNGLRRAGGKEMARLLQDYTTARGLDRVPPEAVISLPPELLQVRFRNNRPAASDDPAMVLALRDKQGKFQGIHAIWLNGDLTDKRQEEPQRQTYGLLAGNFIAMERLDYERPLAKLIIGEGVETVEAASQLTELLGERLPGIAAGGKGNLANVDPPQAREYIVLADVDDNGGGRRDAGKLAQRMVGAVVRIATPDRPEGGKPGYDWNDALIDAAGDEARLKELARTITEAPTFDQVMTDEEKREIRLNALAVLKLNDLLEYEAQRDQAHRDLKIRLSVLDEEVERRCQVLRDEQQRARTKPTPVNMELLEASAREIIECEEVLDMFAKDCSRMIAGEKVNLKMLLLSGTSRLFEHKAAINVALKGPSGGGKSETREEAVKFFPPEDVITFTSLSPSALLYHQEDFAHKILSMGEAQDREQIAFQDLLLRQLMSEGKLRHLVVQKVGNTLVTVAVEKNGPVAFWLTTTRNKLHPENETRLTSLEIDDSQAQTARVVEKVAVIEGLNQGALKADFYKRWHDYQRWLSAGEVRVRIPYAVTLARLVGRTKLANAPRFRRDFGQLLRAIKSHALLHRAHRRRNDRGEIVADIPHDYTSVRALMKDLLATAAELKVREQIKETVEAVKRVCANNAGARDRCAGMPENDPDDGEATVREVAEVLKLDRTATYRRLRAAEHLELVVNLETRKNQPGRYRVTGQQLVAVADMLPAPDALRRAYQEACDRQRLQAQGHASHIPRNHVQPRNRRH